jgi:hypothetical protein
MLGAHDERQRRLDGGGGNWSSSVVLVGEFSEERGEWFWKDGPAPWETVDAFYDPDRNDLFTMETAQGFANLDGCRGWVRVAATTRNDPGLLRGDYECGVGKPEPFGAVSVYRITAR